MPLYVFGQIRRGVTPATNAVAAIMLLITLTVLLVGQLLTRRRGSGGKDTSVAGMIAEQSA
jgi:spermidine/putrescine transport system permease protein